MIEVSFPPFLLKLGHIWATFCSRIFLSTRILAPREKSDFFKALPAAVGNPPNVIHFTGAEFARKLHA